MKTVNTMDLKFVWLWGWVWTESWVHNSSTSCQNFRTMKILASLLSHSHLGCLDEFHICISYLKTLSHMDTKGRQKQDGKTSWHHHKQREGHMGISCAEAEKKKLQWQNGSPTAQISAGKKMDKKEKREEWLLAYLYMSLWIPFTNRGILGGSVLLCLHADLVVWAEAMHIKTKKGTQLLWVTW